jgi:predicted dehydrogenase
LLSQINAGRKNHFQWEINGSKASMQWVQENPNELWIGHRDEPNQILIKDPALMHPEARLVTGYPGGHAEGYPDSHAQLFKAVYNYIGCSQPGDPKPFPTFWDGYREGRLCEAILTSAKEGRWVEVDGK